MSPHLLFQMKTEKRNPQWGQEQGLAPCFASTLEAGMPLYLLTGSNPPSRCFCFSPSCRTSSTLAVFLLKVGMRNCYRMGHSKASRDILTSMYMHASFTVSCGETHKTPNVSCYPESERLHYTIRIGNLHLFLFSYTVSSKLNRALNLWGLPWCGGNSPQIRNVLC